MQVYINNILLHVCVISRAPDQNGVSQAWYIVEVHHSGREPSILLHVCVLELVVDACFEYSDFLSSFAGEWFHLKHKLSIVCLQLFRNHSEDPATTVMWNNSYLWQIVMLALSTQISCLSLLVNGFLIVSSALQEWFWRSRYHYHVKQVIFMANCHALIIVVRTKLNNGLHSDISELVHLVFLLSVCVCLYLCVFVSVSLYLCLGFFLSLHLSLPPPPLSLPPPPSLSLSLCLCLSVSACLPVCLFDAFFLFRSLQIESLAKWVRPPCREWKIPGSNSVCTRFFPGSSHTSDFKIGTPVATLPGAWCYRVSAGAGWPGVSILWLGEMESLFCNFYLSVAARKIVWADTSLRYTRMLLGRKATNKHQL